MTGGYTSARSATGRVAVGGRGGSVVVIDDGAVVWQGAAVPTCPYALRWVDAHRLVIVGVRGWIRALDVDAGTLSPLVKFDSHLIDPTALAGGVVFGLGDTQRLVHLHADTLKMTEYALTGVFDRHQPLRVGDDHVLVWTYEGDTRHTWNARFSAAGWTVAPAPDIPPPLSDDAPTHGSRYARVVFSRDVAPELVVFDAAAGIVLWRAAIRRPNKQGPYGGPLSIAAAWTGDGRHVVVRDALAGVVVWSADGHEVLRQALGRPQTYPLVMPYEGGAVFSGSGCRMMRFDGSELRETGRLALTALGRGQGTAHTDRYEVVVPDRDGALRRVTRNCDLWRMAWSAGHLAVAYDKRIDVWDTASGVRTARWTHGLGIALKAAWNQDGTLLAARGVRGTLMLWRRDGALVRRWRQPTFGWIFDLAWHGHRLLITDMKKGAAIVNTRTGAVRWLHRREGWWAGIWSPNGRRVALQHKSGSVQVLALDHRDGSTARIPHIRGSETTFAWWGDDRLLLSSGEGDAWSWRLGAEPERVPCPPGLEPRLGPDGRLEGFDATAGTLSTVDDEGAVQVRRVGPEVPAIAHAQMDRGYAVADDRGAIHLIEGGIVRMTLRATADGAAFSEVDGQVRWSTWQVPKGEVDRQVWGPALASPAPEPA